MTLSESADFRRRVQEHFDTLTKSQKQIAAYLLQHQEEAAFASASDLAGELGLSEATIVRFARALDFAGFPELRAALQESFRQRVTHSSRLRGRLDELSSGADLFERLTLSEMDYLSQALQTVDRQALCEAVDLLNTHERVFVFGVGPSISLVDLLQIRLQRFGKQVVPITATGREVIEPLLALKSSDLLIVICFFDINPALQLTLEQAAACNCPVILLTDTLVPVVNVSTLIRLSALRGPVSEFHSLVVPMTIINALLLELANRYPHTVVETLDRLDEMRKRLKMLDQVKA